MGRARGSHVSAAQDAQRTLAQDYERLKGETLRTVSGKLRGSSLSVPEADLEGYYNQAWHALYDRMVAGVEITSTVGFLVEVSYRRALDDVRRMRPGDHQDVDAAEHAVAEDDLVDRLDDRRRLRELVEGLRSELGERERIAASLCYLHGYTRPQAAELMGLRPSRMKKVMDEVSKTLGRLTREIEAGTRCDARVSTTKAYALGLLDPDGPRYREARAHIDACSGCRVDVLRMRGLAVVAPAPLLPWGLAIAAGGGAAGGGADAVRPRRRPRRPSRSTATAGVAAAVAVVAASAWGLSGGEDPPDRAVVAPPPVATAGAGGSAATPAAPQQDASERAAEPAKGEAKPTKAKKPRAAAKRKAKARAAAAPVTPEPVATTPVATPEPAPVTPAPAPTPEPEPASAPAATAAVDESGTQEFGVER